MFQLSYMDPRGGLARSQAFAGMGTSSPGYSGDKSRPHEPRYLRDSSHVTAKTARSIPCRTTITAPNDVRDRAARIQMLRERRA